MLIKHLLIFFILLITISSAGLISGQNAFNIIKGQVTDGLTGIDSARVRIQGATNFIYTDSNGNFTLFTAEDSGSFVSISAGKFNWYNADRNAKVADTTFTIVLQPLPQVDNQSYNFTDPKYCNTCHSTIYEQWIDSKHAGAAKNEMVLQLLNGTDIDGNTGVYPGFKIDNPALGGDCADCHAPSAAEFDPGNTDLNDVLLSATIDTNGVFCDFCHKIEHVQVNYGRGINGSITLKRPSAADTRDINFGSLDDVTTFWMGASYNPVYNKSAFCSGCHQYANENGVVVDDTYDSWAESIYAQNGQQCQDCHLKPFTDSTFVSGIGVVDAIKRDPEILYNHYFRRFGTSDSFETVEMEVDAVLLNDTLSLSVNVKNKKAGHKLPTGVSIRNILLVLDIDNGNSNIMQLSGDTLPHFAGIGTKEDGNFSGLPGKAFAIVTHDSIKNEWPTGNWAATDILYDSRIPANATDFSNYKIRINLSENISVHTKLIYRAVYKHWADVKGWDTREYIMADTLIRFEASHLDPHSVLVNDFALKQNFPNPFNSETNISFTIAKNTRIKLELFNLQGKKIETLLDSRLEPGNHNLKFNANGLASGIYVYRLSGHSIDNNFSLHKKLLLLK